MTVPFLTRLAARPGPRGLVITVSLLSLLSASATVLDGRLTSASLQSAVGRAPLQVADEDAVTGDSLALRQLERSWSFTGTARAPIQANATLTHFRPLVKQPVRPAPAPIRHLPRVLAASVRAMNEAAELAAADRPGQFRLLQSVLPRPEVTVAKTTRKRTLPKSSRKAPRNKSQSQHSAVPQAWYCPPGASPQGYTAGSVYYF